MNIASISVDMAGYPFCTASQRLTTGTPQRSDGEVHAMAKYLKQMLSWLLLNVYGQKVSYH